jgi:uncharacterized Ntn-hydrolase superfamily protein
MNRRQFLKGAALAGVVGSAAARGWALENVAESRSDDRQANPADGSPAAELIRAHTFSICAVNAETGEAGVAVASKCLSVGGLVCYAAPGVGAVATQATVNPSYGTDGLDLLRKNVPAADVVARLTQNDVTVTADEERFVKLYGDDQMTEEGVDFFRDKANRQLLWLTSRIRQVGVVDRRGEAAVHTGARAFAWAGSVTGKGFSCQGNLLAGEKVVAAMAEAFERERGKSDRLVVPLLAALEAGDAAGGDKRGKQAAGILVVRDRGHWSGSDRWCDVRVDDHAEPVAELARILKKVGFVK